MQDLKEVFKEAAEIAKQVPENMQEAAFNRALDLLTGGVGVGNPQRKTKRKAPRQVNTTSVQTKSSTTDISENIAKKPRKSASGLGPKPAIIGLIETDFFKTSKTVAEIRDHLKKKRGYDFDSNKLSLALLRLVRESLLERDENQEGQFTYKQP